MKQWRPLSPGVHEYDGGSVIVDEDGFITRTYSMSMREMVHGQSGVPPMPFRLCELVDVPDATIAMTPERVGAIKLYLRRLYDPDDKRFDEADKVLYAMLTELEATE